MKKNLLTKVLSSGLAFLLCLSLTACGGSNDSTSENSGKTESNQTNDSSSKTESVESASNSIPNTPSVEEMPEPTYYYAAIEGAVIVEQNGSQYYVYCNKCEKCGKVESNMKHIRNSGGNLTSSYFCPDCKQSQRVEIEESVNW